MSQLNQGSLRFPATRLLESDYETVLASRRHHQDVKKLEDVLSQKEGMISAMNAHQLIVFLSFQSPHLILLYGFLFYTLVNTFPCREGGGGGRERVWGWQYQSAGMWKWLLVT